MSLNINTTTQSTNQPQSPLDPYRTPLPPGTYHSPNIHAQESLIPTENNARPPMNRNKSQLAGGISGAHAHAQHAVQLPLPAEREKVDFSRPLPEGLYQGHTGVAKI